MDFSFITRGFTWVLDKLNDVVTFFGNLVKAVFVALWNMFLDVLCFGIDVVGKVLDWGLAQLPQATAQQWGSYWAQVPSGVVEVAAAVGIVPAMGIIATAIVIRFALQTVPLVRWGS